MAKDIKRHITHLKSKVVESNAPKLIEASDLYEGEIAVNYAKGYETLSMKNESGDVVTFLPRPYNSARGGETIHPIFDGTGADGGTNLAASWSGNCEDIKTLYDGLTILYKVNSAGYASGDTLTINGGEPHKVLLNASTQLTTHYPVGSIIKLTYDSTQSASFYTGSTTQMTTTGVWKIENYDSDKNTDTIGFTVGFNAAVYKTDAATYRYMLLLTKDETTLTPVNTKSNITASTKTLTTSEFDPFGDIIYKSSTTGIAAGAVIPSATTWTQYPMNLSYSFNTTDTLIANEAVYVVTVPQSNGKVKLHSSPISQTLPTSDDGLVYIYLGHAYNETNIFLTTNHPVYQYKNGQLRQYVGSFGTMAYANTSSYSSATEVNTALAGKSDTGHTHDGTYAKNAFSRITVNTTNIDADTTGDTFTITAGSFVSLTSDTTNDKLTIGVSTGTSSSTLARGDHNHDGAYQAKGSYLTGTTKYAGASTQGGAATSAEKLSNTAAIGSVTNPVFFTANGVPSACTYTLGTSVPSDAVFTDTKVTSVGNHYAPSATSADAKSATASSTSELNWGSSVVTGVTLSGDAKGHITSVTVASGKLKTPVTKAMISLPTGLSASTTAITSSGTFDVKLSNGYVIPTQASIDAKVGSGLTITTTSGLTGGGNLSANRTIGLEATGTSGTYYSVKTDAYGRVISGNTSSPNTDSAATQTNITTNGSYEVLLAGSTATATTTEGASKNVGLTYNPSTSALTVDKKITTIAANNFITGTGTAASTGTSGSDTVCYPAKWTFDKGITVADGDMFTIKIPVDGHAYGVYISLNDGTNYYPVVINGTTILSTQYPVNTYLSVVYESSNKAAKIYPVTGATSGSTGTSAAGVFRVVNYYDTNTTYTVVDNTYLKYGQYKAATVIYRYQVLLQKDETSLLPINTVNNSTATTKALTTEEFDPFGNIFFYNAKATIDASDIIASGMLYQQVLADLRYSFNTNKTLTANKSIYMVCVPQSNGKAKLHTSPISQTLPTTDDGLIYIYLGVTYDNYRVTMTINHPVYQYKNGQLRQYVGSFGTMAYANTSSYSSATEVNTALGAKVNSATYTGHTADTTIHFTTGTVQTQIDNSISGKVNTSDIISAITPSNSGSTAPIATKVVAENELTVSNALNDLNTALNGKANAATTISAGDGLSGGGDLSSNITISLAMPTTYSAATYTGASITSSEPIVYCLCKFTDNLNGQVCPVSNLADGQQCVVIYNNTGSTDNATVSFSTEYLGPEGGTSNTSHTEVKLTVKKYGYGEVNFINIKGTIFLRGV